MKKKITIAGLLIVLTAQFLTSCQVNWFDKHYDVPWWMIAVPVTIFCLIVWIAAGKYISEKKYICSGCGKSFYPKWWKAAISIHLGDDRVFKCPHCNRKSFCHVSRETED